MRVQEQVASMAGDPTQTYLAASIWVFCSLGMMVFNKIAIAAFPLGCTLVALQMAFTVLTVTVVGWRSLHVGSLRDLLLWLRVAPFFAGVLLTSILALKDAPMSLVIVFRGLAPFFGLAVEMFYPNPLQVNKLTVLSLMGMLIGVCCYARHMPGGSMYGVLWVILNNVFVIGDRLLQRLMLDKKQAPVDVSTASCTVINNLAGAIIMLIFAVGTHEFARVPEVVSGLDAYKGSIIGLTCVVGVGIAYAGVWLQSLISATSFLVLATANKFTVILIEVCFMKEVMTQLQIVGASIVIISGVLYGTAREQTLKTREAKERDPLVPEVQSSSASGDRKV